MNDGRRAPRLLAFAAVLVAAVPCALAQPVESVTSQAARTARPTPFLTGGSRWFLPLCVKTIGLVPEQNQRVTQRVQQVAELVGAPVKTRDDCHPNAEIVFSPAPQEFLDAIAGRQYRLLGNIDPAQAKEVAKVRYPIQSWYSTTMMDDAGSQLMMPPDEDVCDPYCFFAQGMKAPRIFISTVVIVVDVDKAQGRKFEALADYVALMALTQARAFARCQAVPSIANLMATDCADVMQPDGLTAGDLAWMRGLYRMNAQAARAAEERDLASARNDN